MNPVSFRTKNQNLLRTKTKSFKEYFSSLSYNFKQSQARVKSSSSLNNLANKLYSSSINSEFSPTKGPKPDNLAISRNKSASRINDQSINPQAMDGLSLRAYHVPCFSELNTNLLKEKRMIESRIASLREAIALQRRNLSKADQNAKKNEAVFNNFTDMYNENHKKSLNLQSEIESTNQDNYSLRRQIKNLKQNIERCRQNIKEETENCSNLETQCKNLKLNYMQEQKQKNNLKVELSKNQKVMTSFSINTKQLEDERAMMLVEINQSVKTFKL